MMLMVTMLDCIRRVPERMLWIRDHREETFSSVDKLLSEGKINELVFIGSGTSLTAARTARYFAEEAAGLRVTVLMPNDFLYGIRVRNPEALYVFVSQTGTSAALLDALQFAKERGLITAAVSAEKDSPIAVNADYFIDMGAGKEEFGMRTIGYSTSVLTLQLLGVRVGIARGVISEDREACLMKNISGGAEAIPGIIRSTEEWMNHSRRNIMRSRFIAFTGTADLYGVAQEGAVKVWEAPQYPSGGYDIDEGMHGPNYGYNDNDAVIVLYDGRPGTEKALDLARYMKNEHNNGYIFGTETLDDKDVLIVPKGGPFFALEYAAAVQTFMYRLAVDGGRDFSILGVHKVMNSYFNSHR